MASLVRSGTEWLVQGVDSWFGDKPFADGGAVTDGRLNMSLMLRQKQQPDFSMRLNAALRIQGPQPAHPLPECYHIRACHQHAVREQTPPKKGYSRTGCEYARLGRMQVQPRLP